MCCLGDAGATGWAYRITQHGLHTNKAIMVQRSNWLLCACFVRWHCFVQEWHVPTYILKRSLQASNVQAKHRFVAAASTFQCTFPSTFHGTALSASDAAGAVAKRPALFHTKRLVGFTWFGELGGQDCKSVRTRKASITGNSYVLLSGISMVWHTDCVWGKM